MKAERSRGGTLDVNYSNTIGEKFSYAVNQMFFDTEINDPLVLLERETGIFQFVTADQPVKSRGFETNVRLSYDILKLFAGYTFTDAKGEVLVWKSGSAAHTKKSHQPCFLKKKRVSGQASRCTTQAVNF